MAWTPFSAEAIDLDCRLRQLHKAGKTTVALEAIKTALAKAHKYGPDNVSYEQFEARLKK